jgi:hypothetical protein
LIGTGIGAILAGGMPSPPRFDARFHVAVASLTAATALALGALLACGGEAPPATGLAAAEATKAEAAKVEADKPKSAGCAKDMDCKGDRVCEKGECVSPH